MLLDDMNFEPEVESGKNNREEDRRHLIYYLKVKNRVTGETVGRVVDITGSGVLLISTDKFDSNSEIPVRIELGDELFEKMHGHLELNIQCRWSKKDINPSYFVNGFSFINETPEQKMLINKLTDIIGFRE